VDGEVSCSDVSRRNRKPIAERAADAPSQAQPFIRRLTRRPDLLAGVALLLLTAAVYSNSLGAGFVLDGRGLILEDARVHAVTAENVRNIVQHTYWWPYGESGLYRPVTTFSYLLNYAILGNATRPLGYHIVNLVLHVINVLLVLAVARRLVAGYWPAVFMAAVWAVHPVQTESVTNIVGRADLLAGGAVLAGLMAYWRSSDTTGVTRWLWLGALTVLTVLGVFSKESAATIVAVVILYECVWWKERRQGRALVFGCVALALALGLMWYQRVMVFHDVPPAFIAVTDNPLMGADFWTAKLTALKVVARYLALLAWPARLSCDYSYAQIPLATGSPSDWIGWLIVAAAVAATFVAYRFSRTVFFVCAMAFVTLLPAANLLLTIGATMAERFLYLPSVAFAFCVVLAWFAVGRRFGTSWVAPAVLSVLIVTLGVRSWIRNVDWHDQVSLMRAAVQVSPDSYKAHGALATALFEADPGHANIDEVIAEGERSLEILAPLPDASKPPDAYQRVGTYLLAKGDALSAVQSIGDAAPSIEARRAYEHAAALLLRCRAIVDVENRHLAELARRQGRVIPEPDHSRIANLERTVSSTYLRLRQPEAAREAAQWAIDEDPFASESFRALSAALLEGGSADESAVALAEGSLMTSDAGLRQELMRRYQAGLDVEGCATMPGPNGQAINPGCPIVRRHICGAIAKVIPRLERLNRHDAAEQLLTVANQSLHCGS
jgi:protein O-mannosyl-transferase